MNNKIIKFVPLLLVASVIAEIIPLIIKDLSLTTSFWIIGITSMVFAITIAFIIFYADLKRNNSVIASIGMFVTVIYAISTIIALVSSRNMTSLSDLETAANLAKFQATLTAILEALRYMSITNLVSLENNSNTTSLFKNGTLISAGLLGLLGVISAWSTVTIDSKLPEIISITRDVFKTMIYSFIFIQVVEAEENINKKVAEPVQEQSQLQQPQQDTNNIFMSNTPKFRNPALEEQEARIKAQQIQNSVNNIQQPQVTNYNQQVPNNDNLQQNQNNINVNIQ